MDGLHLVHAQLARQHYDVGKLCVEAQRLDVADVELGGEVHLLPHLAAVHHDGHVGGDDGGDAGLLGGAYYLAHLLEVLAVDDGIYGEVGLDVLLGAGGGDFLQVVDGEGGGRVGSHVELLNAEVYGVRSGIDGGSEAFPRAHGSHYLIFVLYHSRCYVELQ